MRRNLIQNIHTVKDEYSTIHKLEKGKWKILLDGSLNEVFYQLPIPVDGTQLLCICSDDTNPTHVQANANGSIDGDETLIIDLMHRGFAVELWAVGGVWKMLNYIPVAFTDTVRDPL